MARDGLNLWQIMIRPLPLSPKILSAAIFLGTASMTFANGSIYLETGPTYGGSNPYQYADGGEFTALTTGLPSLVPSGYSPLATLPVTGAPGFPGTVTGFETFCVEDQVDFSVGTTYNYSLGVLIQQGNSVGNLTAGVAWLYEQFATGQLANYDYNTGNDSADALTRLNDAGQLQALIWELEGEPGDPNNSYSAGNPPLSSNLFWGDLIGNFGTLGAINTFVTTTNNSYGVDVLELTDGNSNPAQDQLIYVGGPVPDNGTTAILIGASMLMLLAFRHRFAALLSR